MGVRRGSLALLLWTRIALAGPVDDARAAYEEGSRSYEQGDYASAARSYARADTIIPSATALRAAIDAAVLAHDAVLSMTLVHRAGARDSDSLLAASVAEARRVFAGATGMIVAACACELLIDHTLAQPTTVVPPGTHSVEVREGRATAHRMVSVPPDAEVHVALESPPGVSPAWFVIGTALTLAGAVTTTIFGVDALDQHQRFIAAGCEHMASCAQASQDGQAATLRTNVTLGVTLGLAALTGVALFLFAHAPHAFVRVSAP